MGIDQIGLHRTPNVQAVKGLLAICVTVCLFFCPSACPALGAVVTDRPLLFSFDGSDTAAGRFDRINALDIAQSTGTVYVIDRRSDLSDGATLDKFNLAGEAQVFSGTGSSSLSTGLDFSDNTGGVAVDNSSVNSGRIYVLRTGPNSQVRAFSPAGIPAWTLSNNFWSTEASVDPGGRLWLGESSPNGGLHQFASAGTPPSQISSFNIPYQVRALGIDTSRSLYVVAGSTGFEIERNFNGIYKYARIAPDTWDTDVDETEQFVPFGTNDVAVDQSNPAGHIFALFNETFGEYEQDGTLISRFAEGAIGSGEKIAYDEGDDRVYVADIKTDTIKVFGPAISGTVADATIGATSEIGLDRATFNGQVNPVETPSSYYFEWKRASAGPSWVSGIQSAPQTLPADGEDHDVSFPSGSLESNTSYKVRLISVNTETGLRNISATDEFTTLKPPLPTFESCPVVSAVTSSSAHVTCKINPQGVETTWQMKVAKTAACSAGSLTSQQTIPAGEAGSVDVAEDLQLLASEHYCVSISAKNGGGSAFSISKEFDTPAIPPTQAGTSFAAPRLDTSARLNARVNPQGASFTYHFEYSEDDGETWIALPNLEDASEARGQIMVAQELTGLEPGTTYSYRLAEASNQAGQAEGLTGTSRELTTRSTAEVTLAQPRGIELVNQPDKGVQNVIANGKAAFLEASITADGEKALWATISGAPGGNTSTTPEFLAQRTPNGWQSRSLLPPADQQFGGGLFKYVLNKATAGLDKFIMTTSDADLHVNSGGALLRIGSDRHEEVLVEAPPPKPGQNVSELPEDVEISADGTHVVALNPVSKQLEDVGVVGAPEVVSLMPNGTNSKCLTNAGSFIFNTGSSYRPGFRRVSADGSRIYFTTQAGGKCEGLRGLYQRNRESGVTTLIDPGSGSSPEMIRTTPSGQSMYFTTFSKLDPADINTGRDVYRWDETTGESNCLSCEVSADASIAPETPVLVSNDFSHIYFESEKQLVPGQGTVGEYNIYALVDGELHFAAVAHKGGSNPLLDQREKLSDDGKVLVFSGSESVVSSERSLTADTVTGGGETFQLYLYDDRTQSLECVSCRRGGKTTHHWGNRGRAGAYLNGGEVDQGFALSRDGSTVVFPTAEPLVRDDVNNGLDIYEWRNGVQRLISDGVTDYGEARNSEPMVAAADADGSNLFFALVAPGLTGYEHDGVANLYDARIGGGFPRPTPAARCSEEACQGPLQAAPAQSPPISLGFVGHGNEATKRTKKGRRCAARRRCARSHHKHKQRHHKHTGRVGR